MLNPILMLKNFPPPEKFLDGVRTITSFGAKNYIIIHFAIPDFFYRNLSVQEPRFSNSTPVGVVDFVVIWPKKHYSTFFPNKWNFWGNFRQVTNFSILLNQKKATESLAGSMLNSPTTMKITATISTMEMPAMIQKIYIKFIFYPRDELNNIEIIMIMIF